MGLVSVNYNPHATIGPLPGLATPPNSYTRFCRRWARTRTPAQPRSLTRQPLPRVGLTRWSSAPRCKVCTAAVLPPSASITDPPDSAIAALRWSVHLPIPSRTVNFLRTRSLVLARAAGAFLHGLSLPFHGVTGVSVQDHLQTGHDSVFATRRSPNNPAPRTCAHAMSTSKAFNKVARCKPRESWPTRLPLSLPRRYRVGRASPARYGDGEAALRRLQ